MRPTLCWTKCRGHLNGLFNIVESIKISCKLVEPNLNWFKLSFNIHTTFPFFSKMLNGVEAVWTLYSTFAQYPLNFCWTNVGQMLKPFIQTFKISAVGVLCSRSLHSEGFSRAFFVFPVFSKHPLAEWSNVALEKILRKVKNDHRKLPLYATWPRVQSSSHASLLFISCSTNKLQK